MHISNLETILDSESLRERSVESKQTALVGLSIEHFPYCHTIKDYTDGEGIVVYVNDQFLEELGACEKDYYKKTVKDAGWPDHLAIIEREHKVVYTGEPQTHIGTKWNGKSWIIHQYLFRRKMNKYLCTLAIPMPCDG